MSGRGIARAKGDLETAYLYSSMQSKKIGVGEMANDREMVRNEIRCLLKISIDASKEDREVIRNIIIRLLELYLL